METKKLKRKPTRKTQSENWNIRGVGHETRNAAKLAAQRQGKTIGQWMNTAILEQAQADLKTPPLPAMTQDDMLAAMEKLIDQKLQQIQPWWKRMLQA